MTQNSSDYWDVSVTDSGDFMVTHESTDEHKVVLWCSEWAVFQTGGTSWLSTDTWWFGSHVGASSLAADFNPAAMLAWRAKWLLSLCVGTMQARLESCFSARGARTGSIRSSTLHSADPGYHPNFQSSQAEAAIKPWGSAGGELGLSFTPLKLNLFLIYTEQTLLQRHLLISNHRTAAL